MPGTGGRVDFTEAMDWVSKAFEVIGVSVLALGFLLAVGRSLESLIKTRSGPTSYRVLRNYFGWSVLLALEILVAADLIRTIAVQPSLENVAVLGIIVTIRTFLSFSLDIEIEGVLPWRRHELLAREPKATEDELGA
jgi:uncharacterized membrane protein